MEPLRLGRHWTAAVLSAAIGFGLIWAAAGLPGFASASPPGDLADPQPAAGFAGQVIYQTLEQRFNYDEVNTGLPDAIKARQAHTFTESWIEFDADGTVSRFRSRTRLADGRLVQESLYANGVELEAVHGDDDTGPVCSEPIPIAHMGSGLATLSALKAPAYGLRKDGAVLARHPEIAGNAGYASLDETHWVSDGGSAFASRRKEVITGGPADQVLGDFVYGITPDGRAIELEARVTSPARVVAPPEGTFAMEQCADHPDRSRSPAP